MKIDDGYKSRKFWLVSIGLVISSFALFFDKMTGGEWVTVLTLVSGVYGASNVAEKRVHAGD